MSTRAVQPGAGYLAWWGHQAHFVRCLTAGRAPLEAAANLEATERRLREQKSARLYLSRRDRADLADISTAIRTLRVVRDDAPEGFVFPNVGTLA